MIDLNEPLEDLINTSSVLVLQFGNDTCNPCHAIRYKLKKWIEEHDDVIGRYIDIEKNLALCAQMDVFSAPTVIIYMDGTMIAKESGYFSLEKLLEKTERYLEIRSDQNVRLP